MKSVTLSSAHSNGHSRDRFSLHRPDETVLLRSEHEAYKERLQSAVTPLPPFRLALIREVASNEPVINRITDQILAELSKHRRITVDTFDLLPTRSELLANTDGLVIVLPEYNYGHSQGIQSLVESLQHVRSCTPVAICDLSPGWFGGSRITQELLPAFRRSGAIPLFWPMHVAQNDDLLRTGDSLADPRTDASISHFMKRFLKIVVALRSSSRPVSFN